MRNLSIKNQTRLIITWLLAFYVANAIGSSENLQLDRFFYDLKTFRADFTQVVLDQNLVPLKESSGRLWISRPNKFRWNYSFPFPQQIIADGEQVWIHDIDLEQVTVRKQKTALVGTPAILLAGNGNLEAQYSINNIGTQGSVFWVVLSPKNSDSNFSEIQLGFQENTLRQIQLLDKLEHITRIVLNHVEENVPIPSNIYKFEAPVGIDVVKEDY
tara:strand:- start:1330 stop:1974 length:645 start_codon:yes stop_codon:yes gene_type:complete